MFQELRSRFLPKFIQSGRERVRRALEACAAGRFELVAAEVHALSGEAALLELREIVLLARTAESQARGGTAGASAAIEAALRDIRTAINALGTRPSSIPPSSRRSPIPSSRPPKSG
jgi:HPt (histidine-containing phosphotransfer) domain-containing protein